MSDVHQQEVGEKFGVRQITVLPLHRQTTKATPTNGIANEKKTSLSNHIKGVTYKSNTTLHVATGVAFFTTYCGSLTGEIFNGKWQSCEQTKGNGLW